MSLSSLPNNSSDNNLQSSTSHKKHPLLKRLHEFAKQDAEIQHAQRETKQNNSNEPESPKSKRKESNVRSALISRGTVEFYIKRLEEQLVREEKESFQIIKNQYDLIKEEVELWNAIQNLEEALIQTRICSLCGCCIESYEFDIISYGLFLDSNIDDNMVKWQLENEPMNYILFSDNCLEVPGTPLLSSEDATPLTPEIRVLTMETGYTNGLRSPVSLLNLMEQVPDADISTNALAITATELGLGKSSVSATRWR